MLLAMPAARLLAERVVCVERVLRVCMLRALLPRVPMLRVCAPVPIEWVLGALLAWLRV